MESQDSDAGPDLPMPIVGELNEFMEYLRAMQGLLDPAAVSGDDKSKQGALFAFWMGGIRALASAAGREPAHARTLAVLVFQRLLAHRSAEHVASLVDFWAGSFDPQSNWSRFADAGSAEFMSWRSQPQGYRFPLLISLFGGPAGAGHRPRMTLADCCAMLDNLIRRTQANPHVADQLRSDPTRVFHLVDYAHRVDAALYHGTVDDLNGPVLSTWTYEEGGRKVQRNQPITPETFTRLWDGLFQLAVFRRARTDDLATPIDPVAQHIVGAVWTDNGSWKRCVFLVPADEPSAEFAEWLRALDVPLPRPGAS
jgi:hypothetical protein